MVDSTKVGCSPRYSANATADSGWQTPSTSASVSPASSSAARTMATSSSRPVRSSSPVGDTSSATPTIAAAPRRLRSSLLILATPRSDLPQPDAAVGGSGVLGQLREGCHAIVVGLLGQPEHTLPNDVALDLVGPAVDRGRLGEERHLGDAAGERVTGGVLEGRLVVAVVGVQHAAGPHDAQAEVAGEAHDLAHGELGHVGHAGDVAALLLDRLDAQAVEAAELAERVEPGQVLADAGVAVDATGLGHADEHSGPAAHGAQGTTGRLGLLLATLGSGRG